MIYTIQSANRPFSVSIMEEALRGLQPVWFVPNHNVLEYKDNGAQKVIGVSGTMPMKPKQLNAALDYGFEISEFVMTMDDDYIFSKVLNVENGKKKATPISLEVVCNDLKTNLENIEDCFVAGVSSNTNPFFAHENVSRKGMISGQFLLHKKQYKVRFDEDIICYEDLDYILSHHIAFNGIVKLNKYLINFHMLNRGKFLGQNGVGGYSNLLRKEEDMKKAIHYMEMKYSNKNLIFEELEIGKSIHKKIKWNNLKENILDV